MNKTQKRIHQLLSRQHVNIKELAIRFLIDGNLHQIDFTCDISDGYDDFDQVLMIRKSHGRYIIQEYTINNTNHHVVIKDSISTTHNYKEVITVINNAIDYYSTPTSITDQTGSYAGLQVVQFVDK